MTYPMTAAQHDILENIVEYCEQNDIDDLRPEDLACDKDNFFDISDAMFALANMDLGDAFSAGAECTGFYVDLTKAKQALADWKPVETHATAVVSQTRYTRPEAAAEHHRIEQLAKEQGWSSRTVAAYKAHVTRRTV